MSIAPSAALKSEFPRTIVGGVHAAIDRRHQLVSDQNRWPPAAGRLLPVVGLTFVWNTIRDQLGARIVKTCEHSMVIRGTAADWQQWTGLRFRRVGITWCLALCLPWS